MQLKNGSKAHVAAHQAAEMVARRSYGKLIAFLAARTHDVAAAEDALSEAFAAALVDWPKKGSPENPEAWLLTVARRKAIDGERRRATGEDSAADLLLITDSLRVNDNMQIPDRRLALMFACAHPAIDTNVRAPLILQTVLGLDAKAIGSAFLSSPAAMGKRLVRAKEKIRQAGIPFRIPEREELAGRLEFVLDAIYAGYAEGWSDAIGTDAARRDLTGESIFLARLLTELLPGEPEGLGLLALILYSEARRKARRNDQGEYVPLAEQDAERWDKEMIAEAEGLVHRTAELAAVGRYQVEAALQSAHVYRCRTGLANWEVVVELYDALYALTQSPVVALNRALAVFERDGPEAGLAAMPDETRLGEYQPYWAARAELLARSDRLDEARQAYEMAIGLERDAAVRRFLQAKERKLGTPVRG